MHKGFMLSQKIVTLLIKAKHSVNDQRIESITVIELETS